MTFFQMKCFISLSQTQKMSATATELGLSIPTLSKHITRLESELSVELFSKQQHRTVLTRAGEMILPSIEYMVKQYMEQRTETLRLTDKKYTTSNIAIAFHQNQIIRQLTKFMELTPTVNLTLTEASASEVCALIDEGSADIGIVYGELIDKKYPTALPLREDELVAVVSNRHPLADRGTISVSELKDDTFFTFSGDHLMCHYQLRTCISAGFVPNEIHEDVQITTILLSVAADNGVSLLSGTAVGMLNIKGVVALRLEEKPFLTLTAISASVYPTMVEKKLLTFLRESQKRGL